MKKLVNITLEVESKYAEELTDQIIESTIEDALDSELFCVPRDGKIISIDMCEVEDFDRKIYCRPTYGNKGWLVR